MKSKLDATYINKMGEIKGHQQFLAHVTLCSRMVQVCFIRQRSNKRSERIEDVSDVYVLGEIQSEHQVSKKNKEDDVLSTVK